MLPSQEVLYTPSSRSKKDQRSPLAYYYLAGALELPTRYHCYRSMTLVIGCGSRDSRTRRWRAGPWSGGLRRKSDRTPRHSPRAPASVPSATVAAAPTLQKYALRQRRPSRSQRVVLKERNRIW